MSNLVYFDKARQALEKAASIDEVLQIRDKAEALRVYVRQQGESFDMQNYCAEIKIRAERKAGEILIEMEKNRGAITPSHDGSAPPKLKALGINWNQSSRWQRMALISEESSDREIAGLIYVQGERRFQWQSKSGLQLSCCHSSGLLHTTG